MEIYLDRPAIRQLRTSIADAIEEGDMDTLREDLIEVFTDEQVEKLELRLEATDFYDFISSLLDEWSAEDEEELFEILETHLVEADVEFRFFRGNINDDDDEIDDDDDDDAVEDTEPLDDDI